MVKYPAMRDELISAIESLSNAEYQKQAWVNHSFPPGVEYDEFDNAVHVLFDDLRLMEAPEGTLGTVVRNTEELEAVKQVTYAVDRVLRKLGDDLSDAEYIADPDWADVLQTASEALVVLLKPDENSMIYSVHPAQTKNTGYGRISSWCKMLSRRIKRHICRSV